MLPGVAISQRSIYLLCGIPSVILNSAASIDGYKFKILKTMLSIFKHVSERLSLLVSWEMITKISKWFSCKFKQVKSIVLFDTA